MLILALLLQFSPADRAEQRLRLSQHTTRALLMAMSERAPGDTAGWATKTPNDSPNIASARRAILALDGWKTCIVRSAHHYSSTAEPAESAVSASFGKCAEAFSNYKNTVLDFRMDDGAIFDLETASEIAQQAKNQWHDRLIAICLDDRQTHKR
jgi:hypothetical protein